MVIKLLFTSFCYRATFRGSFKLAVKHSDTCNGTTNNNWNVYSISSAGILDWSKSTWGGIAKHEEDFNQDLNGDGGIGLTAALTSVSTDTTGARLKRDSEKGLYIDVNNDGNTIIAIEDNYGGTPTFDYSNSWNDGITSNSWSQESVAVEEQTDGSFKLAVKNTNSWDGNTETNWNTYTISSSGFSTGRIPPGWHCKARGQIQPRPQWRWGLVSLLPWTSVATDTTGARLKRDSEKAFISTSTTMAPPSLPLKTTTEAHRPLITAIAGLTLTTEPQAPGYKSRLLWSNSPMVPSNWL